MSRSIQFGVAAAAAVLLSGSASLAADAKTPASAACDRACLIKLTDQYMVSENAWRRGGAPAGGPTMFAAIHSRIAVYQ